MSTQQNRQNETNKYSSDPPPYSGADNEYAVQQHAHQCVPIALQSFDGRMPTPQFGSQSCPSGLQHLSIIDQLVICQKVDVLEAVIGFEKNNKYTIFNNAGQKIYYAVEESSCCDRNCCGSCRQFEMKIFDSYNNEVIHLSRPLACQGCCYPCCLQKIEVYSPPGNFVGTVEQDWSICKPIFTVRNALHEKVLKIKGPFCQLNICCKDVKFKVLSKDKTTKVGCISKKWSGILKETFTDAENFGVTFPMDLDVHMKAVLLGACFLIDFMFFEN